MPRKKNVAKKYGRRVREFAEAVSVVAGAIYIGADLASNVLAYFRARSSSRIQTPPPDPGGEIQEAEVISSHIKKSK